MSTVVTCAKLWPNLIILIWATHTLQNLNYGVSSTLWACTYIGIWGNESEGLRDLAGSGATPDVQEVSGLPTVQLNDVHSGHGQTRTIHWNAQTASVTHGGQQKMAHILQTTYSYSSCDGSKTVMLGEPVFGIAWCYQPQWMGHRQHPNLKMDICWQCKL